MAPQVSYQSDTAPHFGLGVRNPWCFFTAVKLILRESFATNRTSWITGHALIQVPLMPIPGIHDRRNQRARPREIIRSRTRILEDEGRACIHDLPDSWW